MTEAPPARGDVVLPVGTKQGGFIYWSDPCRRTWRRTAHYEGWNVYHAGYDERNGATYAALSNMMFGGFVGRSPDCGATWEHAGQGLEYPAESKHQRTQVWYGEPGHAERPDIVFAGIERTGLFRSADGGTTWAEVTGLSQHPTVSTWRPGGGGLCLHTIVVAPDNPSRLYACVSTGGVYRSDDAGETWQDIGAGLPSRFGFPIAVRPHDPNTVYVVPVAADERRFVPDGQMAVWRSRDRGETWQKLTRGMPDGALLTTLREGLATDRLDRFGLFLGTTTGQIFLSRDAGNSWELMVDFLPPINSIATGIGV